MQQWYFFSVLRVATWMLLPPIAAINHASQTKIKPWHHGYNDPTTIRDNYEDLADWLLNKKNRQPYGDWVVFHDLEVGHIQCTTITTEANILLMFYGYRLSEHQWLWNPRIMLHEASLPLCIADGNKNLLITIWHPNDPIGQGHDPILPKELLLFITRLR